MDAATLYTIITMLDGRESIGRHAFPAVAACEAMLKQLEGQRIRDLPTRYSVLDQHLRLPQRREDFSV